MRLKVGTEIICPNCCVGVLHSHENIFFSGLTILKPACFRSPDIQWVPEERVTLFTSEGLIQIGGSMVPRRIGSSDVCFVPI